MLSAAYTRSCSNFILIFSHLLVASYGLLDTYGFVRHFFLGSILLVG